MADYELPVKRSDLMADAEALAWRLHYILREHGILAIGGAPAVCPGPPPKGGQCAQPLGGGDANRGDEYELADRVRLALLDDEGNVVAYQPSRDVDGGWYRIQWHSLLSRHIANVTGIQARLVA